MSAQSLIDQLLKTGLAAVNDARGSLQNARDSGDLGKYATGAAAGGVLALLLGTRSGRRIGGSAVKLGSLAALGMLAYKTYNDWQAQQQATAPAAAAGAPMVAVPLALPAPQGEAHDRVLLKALIAAAKCDGHLDDRERQLVEAELQRSEADPVVRAWVQAELARDIDAADVAAAATTPELAAEIYLASLIVVDETSPVERAYLDALASALRLDSGLQRQLEARAMATA